MKKTIILLTTLVILVSFSSNIFAMNISENDNDDSVLIQNGFPKENIESLTIEDKQDLVKNLKADKNNVQIDSAIMEIDNLVEIETFMSMSEKSLIDNGADPIKVEEYKRELISLYEMSDKQLANKLDTSLTEASYLKKAIEQGVYNEVSSDMEKIADEQLVCASGSISSTKLTYTQAVTNQSTSTQPKYKINLNYTWKSVYLLAPYNDELASCWGGGLVTSSISSAAAYYDTTNSAFSSYNKTISMSKNETIQKGIEFIFPQSVLPKNPAYPTSKTRNGGATFTISQLKKQGFATQVASRYCHRVLSIGSSISFGLPASVNVNVGTAWDASAQKIATISY